MFIHIGGERVVTDDEVIGIFDMDNTTTEKKTIDYLNNAQKKNTVVNVSELEIPKSFIVCSGKQGNRIFISPNTVGTILKRVYK